MATLNSLLGLLPKHNNINRLPNLGSTIHRVKRRLSSDVVAECDLFRQDYVIEVQSQWSVGTLEDISICRGASYGNSEARHQCAPTWASTQREPNYAPKMSLLAGCLAVLSKYKNIFTDNVTSVMDFHAIYLLSISIFSR